MTEWISVKEKLPKQDEIVLTHHLKSKSSWFDLCWYKSGKFIVYNSFPENTKIKPKHWMPLPEPPK